MNSIGECYHANAFAPCNIVPLGSWLVLGTGVGWLRGKLPVYTKDAGGQMGICVCVCVDSPCWVELGERFLNWQLSHSFDPIFNANRSAGVSVKLVSEVSARADVIGIQKAETSCDASLL
eukprot:2243700-Amphidinium_carterae.1